MIKEMAKRNVRYKLPLWESSPKLAFDLPFMVHQGMLQVAGRRGLICDSWPPFEDYGRLPPSLSLIMTLRYKTTILGVDRFIVVVVVVIIIIIIIIII